MFSFGPARGTVASLTQALEDAKAENPDAVPVIDKAKAALAAECASPSFTEVRISLTAQPRHLDRGCADSVTRGGVSSVCGLDANPCPIHPKGARTIEAIASEELVVESHAKLTL